MDERERELRRWRVTDENIHNLVNNYKPGIDPPLQTWDTSEVTNMAQLFLLRNYLLQTEDITKWDVGRVTNMQLMFGGCYTFNQNISNWDVSNVTNMSDMFMDCSTFNQNISNWDVSNVTDMSFMFLNCSTFNQNISSWNVSGVTYINHLFFGCSQFNQPLDEWGPKLTKAIDMSALFAECTSFNQPLTSWNTSNVRSMRQMFYKCSAFNQDLSSWSSYIAKVNNMSEMFSGCTSFTLKNTVIEFWQIPTITKTTNMFYGTPDVPRTFSKDANDLENTHDKTTNNNAVLFIACHGVYSITDRIEYNVFRCPVETLIRYTYAPSGTCSISSYESKLQEFNFAYAKLQQSMYNFPNAIADSNIDDIVDALKEYACKQTQSSNTTDDIYTTNKWRLEYYERKICDNVDKSSQIVVNKRDETIIEKVFSNPELYYTDFQAGIVVMYAMTFVAPKLLRDYFIENPDVLKDLNNSPDSTYDVRTHTISYNGKSELLSCPYFTMFLQLLRPKQTPVIFVTANTFIDLVTSARKLVPRKLVPRKVLVDTSSHELCLYFENVGKLVWIDNSCSTFDINEPILNDMKYEDKIALVNRNLIHPHDNRLAEYRRTGIYNNDYPLGGKVKARHKNKIRKSRKQKSRGKINKQSRKR